MKRVLLYVVFLFSVMSPGLYAQDEPATIRVRKESDLTKAVFDNTERRLMVVDRFGNPRDNNIATYKLYVKTRRSTREFTGYGNTLSAEMLKFLGEQQVACKLFFTGISATDDNGHLVKLPDVIEVWFPECGNCDNNKRKRR